MVNIPPIKMVMTRGWSLASAYSHYNLWLTKQLCVCIVEVFGMLSSNGCRWVLVLMAINHNLDWVENRRTLLVQNLKNQATLQSLWPPELPIGVSMDMSICKSLGKLITSHTCFVIDQWSTYLAILQNRNLWSQFARQQYTSQLVAHSVVF